MSDNEELHGVVKVSPAIWWTCPDCNWPNWDRTVAVKFPDEETEKRVREMVCQDPDDPEEQLLANPSIVRCEKCEERFHTYEDDEEGEVIELEFDFPDD